MTKRPSRLKRAAERGSALLVTLILIGALLAGSAVLVLLQMTSNRSTDVTRTGLESLYCAEAGISAARNTLMQNYPMWNAALNYNNSSPTSEYEPLFGGIVHTVDGTAGSDYTITVADNHDEPTGDDQTVDNDLRIFLISTCNKYPSSPKQVEELVQFTGGGNCYQSQLGGCGGNGNPN